MIGLTRPQKLDVIRYIRQYVNDITNRQIRFNIVEYDCIYYRPYQSINLGLKFFNKLTLNEIYAIVGHELGHHFEVINDELVIDSKCYFVNQPDIPCNSEICSYTSEFNADLASVLRFKNSLKDCISALRKVCGTSENSDHHPGTELRVEVLITKTGCNRYSIEDI